jgi:hypothetical protein
MGRIFFDDGRAPTTLAKHEGRYVLVYGESWFSVDQDFVERALDAPIPKAKATNDWRKEVKRQKKNALYLADVAKRKQRDEKQRELAQVRKERREFATAYFLAKSMNSKAERD